VITWYTAQVLSEGFLSQLRLIVNSGNPKISLCLPRPWHPTRRFRFTSITMLKRFLFEDSGASVVVGNQAGKAGAHSLVFIPRDTWISATNNSASPIHVLAIFSRHGFETYMRAISARPGELLQPLSQGELTRLRSLGHATYWDTSKGPYPPGVAHFE